MKNLSKQSQSNVKQNNIKLVLETIIKNEPLSRADIVHITRISKPTISNLIEELLNKGLISEIGVGKSKGGRKPILLKFNSTNKYFLAFKMGRVGFRIAISDLKGNIINKLNGEFKVDISFQDRLLTLKNNILKILKVSKVSLNSLLKVVCIAPGVYVEMGKELKWVPYNSKNEHYDIKEFFRKLFNKDININHSTKMSLLGEKIVGKAKGFKNVIYIDFAYGLGCSIMVNGDLYFGSQKSAGEIGYFYSGLEEFNESKIIPSEFGNLEMQISGKALQKKGVEAAKKNKNTIILELADSNLDKISAKTIFKAALFNDQTAYKILKESFRYFNMAICNLINLLAPEVVIFGGGFSNAGDFLLTFIQDEIKDKVLILPKLEVSNLKNDASIIGSLHYLIDHTDFLTEL